MQESRTVRVFLDRTKCLISALLWSFAAKIGQENLHISAAIKKTAPSQTVSQTVDLSCAPSPMQLSRPTIAIVELCTWGFNLACDS